MTDRYSEFMELVRDRYSCRSFDGIQLTDVQINNLIEAARLAPSACNRQPWVFVVVNTPELAQDVISAYDREWIRTASTFIIACGDHSQSWHRADGKDHCDVDVAIAVEHICLAASSMGLGTCWVCNFDKDRLAHVLDLPEHIEPIAILPVGRPMPDAPVPEKKRKTSEEITVWGKYPR